MFVVCFAIKYFFLKLMATSTYILSSLFYANLIHVDPQSDLIYTSHLWHFFHVFIIHYLSSTFIVHHDFYFFLPSTLPNCHFNLFAISTCNTSYQRIPFPIFPRYSEYTPFYFSLSALDFV